MCKPTGNDNGVTIYNRNVVNIGPRFHECKQTVNKKRKKKENHSCRLQTNWCRAYKFVQVKGHLRRVSYLNFELINLNSYLKLISL